MGIQIVTRHMCVSTEIKKRVTELCEQILQYCPDVMRVRVVLDDINGPNKAGIDKRCHLMVRGRDHLHIDVEELRDDVWQSVGAAFRQLSVRLAQYKRRGSEVPLTGSSARTDVCDRVFLNETLLAVKQPGCGSDNNEGKVHE